MVTTRTMTGSLRRMRVIDKPEIPSGQKQEIEPKPVVPIQFIKGFEVLERMHEQLDRATNVVKEQFYKLRMVRNVEDDFKEANLEQVSKTSIRLLMNRYRWDMVRFVKETRRFSLRRLLERNSIADPRQYFVNHRDEDKPNQTSCGIMAFCADAGDLEADSLFHVKYCFHTFCFDCMAHYITIKVNDNQDKIKCPHPDCPILVEDEDVVAILERAQTEEQVPVSEEVEPVAGPSSQVDGQVSDSSFGTVETSLERYQRILATRYVDAHRFMTFCPTPDCQAVAVVIRDTSTQALECEDCQALFCFPCGRNWHEPLSCDQVGDVETFNDQNFKYLQRSSKPCPQCKAPIQKLAGCPHMTCRCGHEFCWNCFASWPCFGWTSQQGCQEDAKEADANRKQNDQLHREKALRASKHLTRLLKGYQTTRDLMQRFNNPNRELRMAALLLTTTEIFSVHFNMTDEVREQRENLRVHLNRCMNLMAEVGSDGKDQKEFEDEVEQVTTLRKRLFSLLESGMRSNQQIYPQLRQFPRNDGPILLNPPQQLGRRARLLIERARRRRIAIVQRADRILGREQQVLERRRDQLVRAANVRHRIAIARARRIRERAIERARRAVRPAQPRYVTIQGIRTRFRELFQLEATRRQMRVSRALQNFERGQERVMTRQHVTAVRARDQFVRAVERAQSNRRRHRY